MAPMCRLMSNATSRSLACAPAVLAALGVLTLGLAGAAAQAPTRQGGEIPYLPFRPSAFPAAKSAAGPAAKTQTDLETLKKDAQDLEAIQAEQKKAIETAARLKH